MELEAAILTAAATGALGSIHCAAMCGPLVVAGCSKADGISRRDSVEYFLGRIFSYATVGAVLGHLGRHALCILPMSWVERAAIGLVAVAAAYRGIQLLRGKERQEEQLVKLRARPSRPSIMTLLGQLLPKRGLGLGLSTGILPCGLLLPAWALAAGTASAPAGALVMVVFSLVTMPGLLIPLAGRRLLQRVLSKLPAQAHGLAWCALAVWMAARPFLVASGACH
ncbi:MAG: sulfite exporter TauE/SafE family protein [Byssovorax sp.]